MRDWMTWVGWCVGAAGLTFLPACSDTGSRNLAVEELGSLGAALVSGANGLTADLVLDAEWGQGYCARVLVSNQHPVASTGTWTIGLDLGPSVTFSTFGGVFSAGTGSSTVTPQPHNAVVAAAGSTQFGFCANIPSRGVRPLVVSVGSDLPPIAGGAVISEYKLPPAVDPLVNPSFQTELWASVYRPAVLEAGRRYPLLVFMHGNHATCGRGANPRIDDNVQYSETGTCPATHVVVENHRGFDYLGQDLAARGYLAVSINTNRGVNGVPSPDPVNDAFAIGPRARLLLRHLQQLSEWDAGNEATPAGVGFDLEGRIDFSEVGLLGHSRGGEGVRLAYDEYRRSGSPWPALIEAPVSFRGIFEIGPTDELVNGALINAFGTPWNVLLPACDWDLRDLPGVRPFDRMLNLDIAGNAESEPFSKSFYHVWGTNHNYYNSQWQIADAGGGGTITGCLNHTPLFDPLEFGSAEQRETGRFAAAAFFTANVGADRDEANAAVFDPAFPLPVAYRVNRGYHPGGEIAFGDAADDEAQSLVLEDFLGPTGVSSYGLPNTTGGSLTMHHTTVTDPHDPSLVAGLIQDVVASPSTFFQSNWAPPGDGFDLARYDYLDLRVDRSTTDIPNSPVSFLIELVNSDDSRSSPVPLEDHLELLPPPRAFTGRTLQTVRIPLGAFDGAELDAVRAVRLTFTTPFEAGILVTNIRATRDTTELALGLDAQATFARVSSTALTAPSASAAAAFAPERVTTGNTIRSVVSRGTEVEITLASTRFFELRAKGLELSIGTARSRQARHAGGDLQNASFRLPRAAFDRLGARERVSVDYGSSSPITWDFGTLDKTLLDR